VTAAAAREEKVTAAGAKGAFVKAATAREEKATAARAKEVAS